MQLKPAISFYEHLITQAVKHWKDFTVLFFRLSTKSTTKLHENSFWQYKKFTSKDLAYEYHKKSLTNQTI